MQQAYYEANEMIMQASQEAERLRREANEEAEQIRTGVLVYANELLNELEKVVAGIYQESLSKYDGFINALANNLDIIRQNRQELMEQLEPERGAANNNPEEDYPEDDYQKDDYNFDENTFIEDMIII